MTQAGSASVVLFFQERVGKENPVCIGGQQRKTGGEYCKKQCGVQRPILGAKWLQKLPWAGGTQFLFEQAEALDHIVQFCRNRCWVRDMSVGEARDWMLDELSLADLTLETFIRPHHQSVGDGLTRLLKRVDRKGFFVYAYRGVLQHEVLDCARRLSIELWQEGKRPDIVRRPGGEYYTYLHSLSAWVFETKKGVTLADLCEAVDTRYPDFSSREKRLVFAFCLIREFSRRLNRRSGKSAGVSRLRQELILEFIRRAATSG
ncbi:MAG: hypothetical protein KA054_03095 [Candidatus Moranbacteria bacterium]|nr:hypothetical protein [Candidatus Moranbacteria bacterium]